MVAKKHMFACEGEEGLLSQIVCIKKLFALSQALRRNVQIYIYKYTYTFQRSIFVTTT